jgi:hypothetical protein
MDWVLGRVRFGRTRDMCVVSWPGAYLRLGWFVGIERGRGRELKE